MESSCKEKLENFDTGTFNRLLLSLGHLKFSLRAVAAEGVPGAVLASEESEIAACEVPRESNRILGKVISEVASTVEDTDDKDTAKRQKCGKLPSNKSSIENLQMVREKLHKELENIRLYHQSVLSEKLKKEKNHTFS